MYICKAQKYEIVGGKQYTKPRVATQNAWKDTRIQTKSIFVKGQKRNCSHESLMIEVTLQYQTAFGICPLKKFLHQLFYKTKSHAEKNNLWFAWSRWEISHRHQLQ